MFTSSISFPYLHMSLSIRMTLLFITLMMGAVSCASSPYEEKSQSNRQPNYQLVLASDSSISRFTSASLTTTGETVYLSTNPADMIVKFDSVIPSVVATGLHIYLWISKDELNRLSELIKHNIGRRLAFRVSDETLTAAKIIQPMTFTGGPINVGVTTSESNAIRLLSLFNTKK